MNKVTRLITQHDKDVAERLKKIFNHKKHTLGITQTTLADKLGIKQPTVAQYLNGTIALRNASTLCAFAAALEVSPTDIDPKLNIRFPALTKGKSLTSDLDAFTLSGSTANASTPFKKLSNTEAYVVVIDERYAPVFPKNTRIVADPAGVLKKNQWILIQLQESKQYYLYRLSQITTHSIVVYFQSPELLREALTRKHHPIEEVDTIAPEEVLRIPLNTIAIAHKIRGMEFPD